MRLRPKTLLLMALVLSGYGGGATMPNGTGDGKTVRPSGEPRFNTNPYAWIEGYSAVAPYDQCLYIAAVQNGTPVDYNWTVTGATGQASGPYWIGGGSGSSIHLDVEITLDDGRKVYAMKDVTVDPWAGECTWY
jgi:hypothetical protein